MDILPIRTSPVLGDEAVPISALAWGMWRTAKMMSSTADVARLVRTVIDAGINVLDTADIYGFNGSTGFGDAERLLGEILASDRSLRQRLFIATKAGIRPPAPYDQSAPYLAQAIDDSLTRLNVDRIDLWQVHRPDMLTHPAELAAALDRAVESGKVRMLGVSNFTTAQIAALQHFLRAKLVTTQPEISPARLDSIENGELDQAMMMGLTPLAWSPLGGGRIMAPQSERDHKVAAALDEVAAAQGVSRAAAAYSWLMAHPAGIIPIVGSQSAERIREAVQAVQVQWRRATWYGVLAAARGRPLP